MFDELQINIPIKFQHDKDFLKKLQEQADKKGLKLNVNFDQKSISNEFRGISESLSKQAKIDLGFNTKSVVDLKRRLDEVIESSLSKFKNFSTAGITEREIYKDGNRTGDIAYTLKLQNNQTKEAIALKYKYNQADDELIKTGEQRASNIEKLNAALEKQRASTEKLQMQQMKSYSRADFDIEKLKAQKVLTGENIKIAEELSYAIKKATDTEDFNRAKADFDIFIGSAKKYKEDLNQIMNSTTLGSKIEKLSSRNLDVFRYNAELDKKKIGDSELEKLYSDFERLSKSFKELKGEHFKIEDIMGNPEKYQQMATNVKELEAVMVKFNDTVALKNKENTQEKSIASSTQELDKLIIRYEKFLELNSRLKGDPVMAKRSMEIGDMLSGLTGTEFSSITELTNKLERAKNEVVRFEQEVRTAGLTGENFFDRLTKQAQKLGVYVSGAALVWGATRQLKKMTNNVIELDKALVDLQVVTGKTRDETKELLKTYSDIGKELGRTTGEIASAADVWLRQGYSLVEVNKLLQDSSMLSVLGQIDSAEATQALTSASKGYKVAVEDVTGIVDKFTAVDKEAAISAGYIATAMAQTATGARIAGVDMDKLNGYIAAVGEVTQDAAESVGNFYKVMFSRMGNIKGGKLFDPESAEDLSDVEVTLAGVGIKLRDTKKEFRNFGEVLDETASGWTSFSSVQQRAIAVAFAGTRQQEKFLTLMDNYSNAMKYAETSTHSAGTALEKYENSYLNSVAAAQNKFNVEFEKLSLSILNSELIKGVYSSGAGLLGYFNSILGAIKEIPTFTAIATAAISGMNKGLLRTVAAEDGKGFLGGKVALQTVSTIKANALKEFEVKVLEDSKALFEFAKGYEAATDKGEFFKLHLENASASAKSHAHEIVKGKITIEEWGVEQLKAAKSTTALTLQQRAATVATKALNVAMHAAAGVLIGAAIHLLVKGFQKLKDASKDAIEAANELHKTWADERDLLRENSKTIKEISEDYERLSRGVNEHGKNISLTAEEYEKYNSIVNKVSDMFPHLVKGYTEEGNAILKVKGSVEELIEAYEKQKIAAEDAIIAGAGTAWKGFTEETKGSLGDRVFSTFITKDEEKIATLRSMLQNPERYNMFSYGLEHIRLLKEAGVDASFLGYDITEQIKNGKSSISAYITQIESHINGRLSKVQPIIATLLSRDANYSNLTDETKEIVDSIVSNFDLKFLNKDEFKDNINAIPQWIVDNIISAFDNTDYKNALTEVFTNLIPNMNELSLNEWLIGFEDNISILPEALQTHLRDSFKETINDLTELEAKFNDLDITDKLRDELKALSISDLKLLINNFDQLDISTNDTLESITERVSRFKEEISEFVPVNNFEEFAESLGDIEKNITGVLSAMEQLNEGTALTASQLAALALEYPKLLEASNLFTDGSVEGQRAMLEAILNMNQQEHDAKIDVEIGKLKAFEEALESQLDLEEERSNIVLQIANDVANGEIITENDLNKEINKLRNLQGKNFVEHKDGELQINKEANDGMLSQNDEMVDKSEEIWKNVPYIISNAFVEGGKGGVRALNDTGRKASSFTEKIRTMFNNVADFISNALGGKKSSGGAGYDDLGSDIGGITEPLVLRKNWMNMGGSGTSGLKVNDVSVSKWADIELNEINSRIEAITAERGLVQNKIANLEALKGLDLSSLYGGGSKGGKGGSGGGGSNKAIKDIEAYTAALDKYYKALYKLGVVQKKREDVERKLNETDDFKEKIPLQKELSEIYEREQVALTELRSARTDTIEETVKSLKNLGFVVKYNADINDLYIDNLEHLNEITADSKGEHESLQEATNELRKETEGLIDVIGKLNDENRDADNTVKDLTYTIKKSKDEIIGFIEEVTNAAAATLKTVSEAYEVFESAIKAYADTGTFTIDTFQSILGLGTEYLSYLYKEGTQLKVNKEAVQELVKIRAEELAITEAMSLVMKLKEHQTNKDTDAIEKLAGVAKKANLDSWSYIESEIYGLKLSAELQEAFLKQVKILRSMSSEVKKNIDEISKEIAGQYKEIGSSLDYILDLTIELIKHETGKKVENLNKQIDAYKKLIDLKKEELKLDKEEDDYEKKVKEKNKEIATLQAKIDRLSLDDSREAKAERAALLEKLKEAQEDLGKIQSEYAYDAQLKALDKMAESYEKAKEEEIETLEKSISSQEKLFQLALDRINKSWDSLYADLMEYNSEYGSSINAEVKEEWEKAQEAVDLFGDFITALIAKDYILSMEIDPNDIDSINKFTTDFIKFAKEKYNIALDKTEIEAAYARSEEYKDAFIAFVERTYGIKIDRKQLEEASDYSENFEKALFDFMATVFDIRINPKEIVDAFTKSKEFKTGLTNFAKTVFNIKINQSQITTAYNSVKSLQDAISKLTGKTIYIDTVYRESNGSRPPVASIPGDGSSSYTPQWDRDSLVILNEPTKYQVGDVDMDGKITSADAELISKFANRMATPTPKQKLLADADGSGHISAYDGTLVLRYVNDNTKKYPEFGKKYHTGGIAGDEGTLKDNELMAILEKGEIVLNDGKKDIVYHAVDFATELSSKLGASLEKIKSSGLYKSSGTNFMSDIGRTQLEGKSEAFVFSPNIEVTVNNADNMSSDIARENGELIADIALERLSNAFSERGLGGIGVSRIKM